MKAKLRIIQYCIKALLYQLISFKRNDNRNESTGVNDVVVMASEAIGDNLVFLDPFRFIEHNNKLAGRNTFLVCNSKMASFWETNKSEESTKIYSVNKKDFGTITERQNITEILSIKADRVILPMHHTLSVIIASGIRSNAFYALLYNEWFVNRPLLIKLLYMIGEKQIIRVDDGFFIGSAFEMLISHLCEYQYNWRPANFVFEKQAVSGISDQEYIFFAPYSNLEERSLSNEQVKKIIDYLLVNTPYTILISSTSADKEKADAVCRELESDRVINLAGKTSFKEYLSLIAKAKLVIGTDSGSIHYAASLNVKSIALCGLWSGAFLPYRISGMQKDLQLPICVFSNHEYKCKYCLGKKGGIKSSNCDCYRAIHNEQSRLCLSNINFCDVANAIISALQ